jgi:hypothetical protein
MTSGRQFEEGGFNEKIFAPHFTLLSVTEKKLFRECHLFELQHMIEKKYDSFRRTDWGNKCETKVSQLSRSAFL